MTLFWNILQSIITILEIRVCVWMMECFARPRYRGIKQKIVVWIVSLGVGGLYALNRWVATYYSRVIILISLFALGLASLWLFAYDYGIAIFIAVNYLMIGGLLDLAFMGVAEAVTHKTGFFVYVFNSNNGYRICIMCVSKLLLFLIVGVLQRKIDKAVICHLTGKGVKVICILLCIIEYVGIHTLNKILSTNYGITDDFLRRTIFYLIVIFLMLAIAGIAALYYDKKDQLKQKDLYLESLNYENQRMIRLYREREVMYHDFKNHLFLLDSYVWNGEMEQFRQYMDSIKKPFLEKPVKRQTGHTIMNLILNYKISEAQSYGIQVRCRIRGYMTFRLTITDEEVCSLMGNLWDNAIEACRKLEEGKRWINYEMRITENKFLIELDNPYDEFLVDDKGDLQTTKIDKKSHGIGVRTIKSITERYGGYFNYEVENHVFKVEIMIYNE